jgi:hypothetical protein
MTVGGIKFNTQLILHTKIFFMWNIRIAVTTIRKEIPEDIDSIPFFNEKAFG